MRAMRVIDAHENMGADKNITVIPSGRIDILAEDGRRIFSVFIDEDGTLEVSAGEFCKVNDKILDSWLNVKPVAANCVRIFRDEYQQGR